MSDSDDEWLVASAVAAESPNAASENESLSYEDELESQPVPGFPNLSDSEEEQYDAPLKKKKHRVETTEMEFDFDFD